MNMEDAIAIVREHDERVVRLGDAVTRGRGHKMALRKFRLSVRELLWELTGEEPSFDDITRASS